MASPQVPKLALISLQGRVGCSLLPPLPLILPTAPRLPREQVPWVSPNCVVSSLA